MKLLTRISLITIFSLISLISIFACETESKHQHTYGEWVVTLDATCMDDGVETRFCITDSSHTETRTIPAHGHDYGEWVITLYATCTTDGVETRVCAWDNSHIDTRPVFVLDHDYQLADSLNPTCTTDGFETYTCSHDNSHTYTDIILALGHDHGKWVTVSERTCTEAGRRELQCTRDGFVLDFEEILASGHDYQLTNRVAPTCIADGYETYVCRHDNSHTYTDTLLALGHDNGEWVTTLQPTCTEDGHKELRCIRDGFILDTDVIVALGHDNGEWVTTLQPTCTEDGYKELRCTRDGFILDTDVITALDHDYQLAEKVHATCIADGFKKYVCSHDAVHTYTDTLSALGHDNGEWVTALQPTCTEAGRRELRCTRDSFVLDSEEITVLGHDYRLTGTVDATCTVDGYETYTCTHDTSHTYRETLSAFGHDFGDWELLAEATNSRPESQQKVCKNNSSHTETRYVAPELELGENSDEISVGTAGAWFMLVLEEATKIQLGIQQMTGSGTSISAEAYLYSDSFIMLTATTPRVNGIVELEAGIYFIKAAYYRSPNQTVQVRVDDFNALIDKASELVLDELSISASVDNIGTWFKIELSADTLIQISYTSTGTGFVANLFSENNPDEILLGTNAYDTKTRTLAAGIYYVRKYNVFPIAFSTPTGRVELINLSSILEAAQSLELDTPSQVTTVDVAGIWFKLELKEEAHVRFIFTEASYILGVRVHNADENLTEFVGHNHNGGHRHTATLPSGNYYVRLFLNSSSGSTQGSLTIMDLTATLNAATSLVLDEESQSVTVDRQGKWFKLSLEKTTTINIVTQTLSGSLSVSVHALNNLYNSIGNSDNAFILQAGEYYVFLSSSNTGTGTIIISDFSAILNASPQLTLGTPSEKITFPAVAGNQAVWLKLVITETTYVSISLIEGSGSFSGMLYHEDNLSSPRTSVSVSGPTGGANLAAGTYYVRITSTNAGGSGIILIEKF